MPFVFEEHHQNNPSALKKPSPQRLPCETPRCQAPELKVPYMIADDLWPTHKSKGAEQYRTVAPLQVPE